ncbi:MarR family winged helix-turn-helix transcriptional regulator [Micromonospora musae]|uniref:MarR family winged helix-turn-helix transcriptional regulator n=1 Tax=Micromonospora musae TaxID=1894970 RepID=UPI0034088473
MHRRTPPTPATPAPETTGLSPSVDSEITWLLHRAAQRLRRATGEKAEEHGLTLRDYIVLSALRISPGLMQGDLGKSLGLDKTTLMSQLDRLEHRGLIVRHSNPRDRRLRIPVITEEGEAQRATLADACAAVEESALAGFHPDQIQAFRRILITIIGDSEDPGSCL